MVTIKNTQRTIKINSDKIKKQSEKILQLLNYDNFDLGIWLTSNATIKKYNKQYRNKDKVTDILSFPFYTNLKVGQRIVATKEDEQNLGDLIIAPVYVQKAAHELNVTFEQRMLVLLVHGICHLLGYDHIKDADYKVMHKKELDLLKQLNAYIDAK